MREGPSPRGLRGPFNPKADDRMEAGLPVSRLLASQAAHTRLTDGTSGTQSKASWLGADGSGTYCRPPRSDLFGKCAAGPAWPVERGNIDARDRFCSDVPAFG